MHHPIRSLSSLALAAVVATTSVALMATPTSAVAAAAPQKVQVPGYYHMAFGPMQVTALYDGYVDLAPKLLKGASAKTLQSLMARMFQESTKGVQTAVNGFLVNTGDRLVLVDTGAAGCFGPTLGNIAANLKASGYKLEDVDAVLLTHLHPDHVCGVADAAGKPLYPNATVYASQGEADFWLNKDVMASKPDGMKPFFEMAQKAVAGYQAAGKFKTFKAGDDLLKGVQVVPTPGHTPGHTSFLLSAGDKQLLLWGDIVHNHATQFARPEIAIEFDVDSPKAIATRKALFKRAAHDKLWVGGAHMPFPGIGHVGKDGKAYRWVPVEYGPLRSDR